MTIAQSIKEYREKLEREGVNIAYVSLPVVAVLDDLLTILGVSCEKQRREIIGSRCYRALVSDRPYRLNNAVVVKKPSRRPAAARRKA